ncbi:cytochrome P450 [Cubamyces menziesii]|nr:cytochrome P450 [Cubamyces menziesii]
MPSIISPLLSWWLLGGVVVLAAVVKTWRRDRRKLPPGPRGIPLLGNVLQTPATSPERAFADWAKIYGDVIYVRLFRTPMVVLNSIEAARDLLDKRSSIYSDRPRMVLLAELLGQGATLPVLRYGERLRKQRRWLQEGVGNKVKLRSYQHIQLREVKKLLRNLSQTPEHFVEHLHLYLAAIMVEITYGRRVSSMNDEMVRVADLAVNSTDAAGRPGSMPIDFIPFLKHVPAWLPGAGWKRHYSVVRAISEEWMNLGYQVGTSGMADGTITPCIFTNVMAEYGGAPPPEEQEDIKGLGFSVYGGYTLQTRGTLAICFLMMTRNTEAYIKAQAEVDRVVGHDRLPTFSDRESLPYVEAFLEEVYRSRPSLPLAVPHRVMTDDHYREYDIPAGCNVFANTWAMSRDTRYYPEPEEFRPERYLTSDGRLREDVLLPSSFVFGFGRRLRHRICPGQAMADASIWLAVANVFALFDVRKVLDEDGKEVTPPAAFFPGITSQPVPFPCRITLRSEKAAELFADLDE